MNRTRRLAALLLNALAFTLCVVYRDVVGLLELAAGLVGCQVGGKAEDVKEKA